MTVPTSTSTKVSGILCLLFAISTLISQTPMDFFASIFSLYLIFIYGQKRWAKEPTTPLFKKIGFEGLILLWILAVGIGFAINPLPPEPPRPFYWLDRILEFWWLLVFYLFIGRLSFNDFEEKHYDWFSYAAIVTSVLALIDFAVTFEVNSDRFQRLKGLYQYSMTHAHVYGPLFCMMAGIYLYHFGALLKKRRWFYGLSTFLVGLTVFLTQTRGIWIGVFISIVTMGFLWQPRKGLIILLGSILAGVTLYWTVPYVQKRVDFTLRIFKPGVTRDDTYDTERVILWKTNLEIFSDHPLFGVGYGQNKYWLRHYYDKHNLPPDQLTGHAHNQYIHLLAGTGLVGIFCYLSFLFSLLWMAFKAFRFIPFSNTWHRGLALGSISGQICFIVGGLTEANFEHSKVRYGMIIIWGLGVWLYYHYRPQRQMTSSR